MSGRDGDGLKSSRAARRDWLALALVVPGAAISIYVVHATADVLARILPSRLSEALFPAVPTTTGIPVDRDAPELAIRQLLAMAYLVWFGRWAFHKVRGWTRRRRAARNAAPSDNNDISNLSEVQDV